MSELYLFPDLFPEKKDETGAQDVAPLDWKAREDALDVGRSWIVEAPAGSGKTGLLIQRYLKLLGQEGVTEPEQVLAITFTTKATQEIRERILEELEAAAEGAALKRDAMFERTTRNLAEGVLRRDDALGWALLDRPRRLRVQTIDSVCAEIARSLPVLSGSGGGLAPVEDAAPLYREAARRTLMQLGGNDAVLHESLTKLLLHRDGSLSDCERLIAEMLERREQWAEFVPLRGDELTEEYLDGVVRRKLERALEIAICAGLTRLEQTMPAAILRDLAMLARSLSEDVVAEQGHSPIAVCADRIDLPSANAEDLAHWRALIHLLVTPTTRTWRKMLGGKTLGFLIPEYEKKRLREIVDALRHDDHLRSVIESVDNLPPAKYPQEQWEEAKALFRVLRHALAELRLVFAERGECDFTELTLLAKRALDEGGASEMTAAMGMRLEHLLVDEMQDTSTSHYEVIQLLTQGWDGASQTVFLVGDPKQSIYMFRQARVELFLRTMETKCLGELPLGGLHLTTNFRSQAALVDAFNDDFELLFPQQVVGTNAGEVAFVKAVAVRPAAEFGNEAEAVRWHTNALPAGLATEEKQRATRTQRQNDAAMVRAVVEQWRATPLPEGRTAPWRIAVLVRNRNHLAEIVSEFKGGEGRTAIPYRAVDIEELGERQEVLDLLALTRALLHPADRVAWLAVLRAPWCGMGLADLHVLTGTDDLSWRERSLWDAVEERGEFLSADGVARLERLWPVMEAAEQHRGRLSTAEWVERTWRTLGGDAYLAAEEMENARQYLQLLDAMEEESGRIDLKQLEQRMKRLYAESAASADAVELLTIHKAKGLEWDVVIVPGLERLAQGDTPSLLTWEEIDYADEGAARVVLAPIEGKGEESRELNAWLKGMQRTRKAAERRRLFYVACTRAREALHLFAAPETKKDGGISRRAGSLLEAAWPAAKNHFAEEASAPGSAAKVFVMSRAPRVEEDEFVGELAAGADEQARPAMLERLPLQFEAERRFAVECRLSYGEAAIAPAYFERPEGSFEARAFGNAVHAFAEMLTKRLADRTSVNALLREVPEWTPRIAAVLRGDGLAPMVVDRLVARVKTALGNMLKDAEGLWVLGQHEGAMSEFALTSWNERRSSVRVDRLFLAGPRPLDAGSDSLWIIDYKTTTHGREGVEKFLAEERLKYAAQMEAYARMMQDHVETGRLRVGLYYPMLPRLVWWEPEMKPADADDYA
ncbi:MAG TPA: UvrD-helicase domain-containing protein [Edaphobacter sp.]|nr:UvrD-helicase domain-containing protein [Edaphobacter sp.]